MNNGDKIITVRPVTFQELYGRSFGTPEQRASVVIPQGATGTFLDLHGIGDKATATVEWDGEYGENAYAAKWLAVGVDAVVPLT